LTPEPHHDNHELLSARIGITASSATAQSQVNRITTGTSKVNMSQIIKFKTATKTRHRLFITAEHRISNANRGGQYPYWITDVIGIVLARYISVFSAVHLRRVKLVGASLLPRDMLRCAVVSHGAINSWRLDSDCVAFRAEPVRCNSLLWSSDADWCISRWGNQIKASSDEYWCQSPWTLF